MKRIFTKHKNILDFALSTLFRKKLKNLSLLAVYTVTVFLFSSLLFFVKSIKHESEAILQNSPDIIVQKQTAGRHDLISEQIQNEFRDIPGVADVSPRYWGYYYDPVFKANFTIIAAENGKMDDGNAEIGYGGAKVFRVAEGDMISLSGYNREPLPLATVKVFKNDSELISSDLIVISRNDFNFLFNFPSGYATDIALNVPNQKEHRNIASKIGENHPEFRIILKSDILKTYDSIFDWRGGVISIVLSTVLLSFIIFSWDKAAGLSQEEKREIGILKSTGWDTSDILTLKTWEGIIISLTSCITGSIAAYLHVFYMNSPLFSAVLKGWSVLYPDFRLSPAITIYDAFILILITVMPYTAATLIPAWIASTGDPDAAMRSR